MATVLSLLALHLVMPTKPTTYYPSLTPKRRSSPGTVSETTFAVTSALSLPLPSSWPQGDPPSNWSTFMRASLVVLTQIEPPAAAPSAAVQRITWRITSVGCTKTCQTISQPQTATTPPLSKAYPNISAGCSFRFYLNWQASPSTTLWTVSSEITSPTSHGHPLPLQIPNESGHHS
jgi:hypothetical protein